MGKTAKLSGQADAEPTAPPYRIICNSEHFIVLNPVRRTKPNPPNRPDEPHEAPAAPSKRFQANIKAAREKGRILRPDLQ